MVIHVPENLISVVPHLKSVRVEFYAFPNKILDAKIKEISNEATEDTRTYPVTLIMDQPKDFRILPGMAGNAIGPYEVPEELQKHQYGITIPINAVFTPSTEKENYVWVIDAETKQVSKRKVKVERILPNGAVIESGLSDGEWIATTGLHTLDEGQEVRILEPR